MDNILTVIYKRNNSNDGKKENIQYTGYDILWEDFSPVNTKIAKFCTKGIETILGFNPPEIAKVEMHFMFCKKEDPKPKGIRTRRMYLLKENDIIRMHFKNDVETDLIFTKDDDEKVKTWVNFDNIKENEKQWLNFYAVTSQM